jgi:hypothetical protein
MLFIGIGAAAVLLLEAVAFVSLCALFENRFSSAELVGFVTSILTGAGMIVALFILVLSMIGVNEIESIAGLLGYLAAMIAASVGGGWLGGRAFVRRLAIGHWLRTKYGGRSSS